MTVRNLTVFSILRMIENSLVLASTKHFAVTSEPSAMIDTRTDHNLLEQVVLPPNDAVYWLTWRAANSANWEGLGCRFWNAAAHARCSDCSTPTLRGLHLKRTSERSNACFACCAWRCREGGEKENNKGNFQDWYIFLQVAIKLGFGN